VLTITTTGAHNRLRHTTPLLGCRSAVTSRSRYQLRAAGHAWLILHLRAQPRAEVTYRNRSVAAIAREAEPEERQAILAQARKIYDEYDAYARRITGREIPLMILNG
jgi:deazaflavin-dependent oxidoreductase (nitroreductase family)